MKKLFLISFFIVMSSVAGLAQGYIYFVSGNVRSSKDGDALVGATIEIKERNRQLRTDRTGYHISLPVGKYTFKISYVGHKTKTDTITVIKKADQVFDFILDEEGIDLNEVRVTEHGQDANVGSTNVGLTRLNIKAIKKIPALLGEVDVVRSLLLLPGVTTVGEGATGFNVRGGSIDQNLVLMDDAPIYNASHLMGLLSVFNPDVVKDITFYRGGVPAQYGGRVSSVLSVKIKDPSAAKWVLNGGVGILASRLSVEGPIVKEKLDFLLAARGSAPNYLFKLFPNPNLRNSRSGFYDLTARLVYKPSPKDRVYLTAFTSYDKFKIAGDSLANLEINASSSSFNWRTTNATLKWAHTFNNNWFATLTGVMSNYSSSIVSDTEPFDFDLSSSILYQNLKIDLTRQGPKNRLDFGASWVGNVINPGKLLPLSSGSSINSVVLNQEKSNELSAYLSDEIVLSDKLSLTVGLRYTTFLSMGGRQVYRYAEGQIRDEVSVIDSVFYGLNQVVQTYGGFEPRFLLKYSLSSNSSVKLSYHRMRQFIQLVSNTTAALPTARWKMSDSYIKPQVGDQVSLGYFQNFKSNMFETSLEVYYKTIENAIDYRDGVNLLLLKNPETAILQGNGRAYGVEVMLRKNTGRLTGWTSYTYSQTEMLIKGAFAETTINNGSYYPANHNRPHNLNLVLSYEQTKRISYSLNFTFASGRPATFPKERYYVGGVFVPNYTDRNQDKIPDYHRLDLSMTIDSNPDKLRTWKSSWVFAIYNVYAYKNAYSVFFRSRNDNALEFYNRGSASRLSVFGTLIPSITYNFKF
jgi:hypothetical protein